MKDETTQSGIRIFPQAYIREVHILLMPGECWCLLGGNGMARGLSTSNDVPVAFPSAPGNDMDQQSYQKDSIEVAGFCVIGWITSQVSCLSDGSDFIGNGEGYGRGPLTLRIHFISE